MRLPIALLFPLIFVLSACDSAKIGKKDRYEYPASKLASPKRVKGVSTDGRFVILNDGSMWNIDWSDVSKVRRWSSGDAVNVIATSAQPFPYALIKQSNGVRVAARHGRKLD